MTNYFCPNPKCQQYMIIKTKKAGESVKCVECGHILQLNILKESYKSANETFGGIDLGRLSDRELISFKRLCINYIYYGMDKLSVDFANEWSKRLDEEITFRELGHIV